MSRVNVWWRRILTPGLLELHLAVSFVTSFASGGRDLRYLAWLVVACFAIKIPLVVLYGFGLKSVFRSPRPNLMAIFMWGEGLAWINAGLLWALASAFASAALLLLDGRFHPGWFSLFAAIAIISSLGVAAFCGSAIWRFLQGHKKDSTSGKGGN